MSDLWRGNGKKVKQSDEMWRRRGAYVKVERYKSSTLSLAHGVLRKNFKLDLTEGLLLKQLILIIQDSSFQP